MSVTPTPQRILREGEVGQLKGFSRNLRWQWGRLTVDYRLAIFHNKPESPSALPALICNLDQTSLTWGFFQHEGAKEYALRFALQEPPLKTSSTSCCFASQHSNSVTLILHSQQELATWIRAIQILFANSEHQPVQQGDGGSVGDECTICLSEFENKEIISVLPCGHRFHEDCVREWLTCSVKCPLCKKDSVDTGGQPLLTSAQFSKKK